DVLGKINQARFQAIELGNDQLPIPLADGPLRAVAPEERLVWPALVRAGDVRHQVHAVELPREVYLAARRRQCRRQYVQVLDREVIGLAGGNLSLPLHAERYARTPLGRLGFETAERRVP